MAQVCSFRGIRYRKEKVSNLGAVICPPYDVITPEEQRFYYRKSDYNIIRLELPTRQSGGGAEAEYSSAARTLKTWLAEGVLQADDSPVFYLHDHYFTYQGMRRRRELIARVKLVPWGEGVYPHEETSSKVKRDRLKLLRACQATFSPILALYQDRGGEIAGIFSSVSQYNPPMELVDSGERHLTWAITEPDIIHRISELLSDLPFYVADGHHRYEIGLAYQRERMGRLSSPIGKEAFNYIMMSLVEFSDPGLVVLPIHRLVRGISLDARAKLKRQLRDFFTAEIIPLSNISGDLAEGVCDRLKRGGKEEMVLGVLGLEGESLVMLTPRPGVPLDKVMPQARSQAYKKLGVSFLNHLILKQILGIAFNKDDIGYTSDIAEACREITEGHYQLAFLVQLPELGVVKAVADAGDRMPRKSTYFYPKVPAGLVINPLW
jgi:uncharacterized protein (DUF1015 family)